MSLEEDEEVVVPEEEEPISDIPNAINTTFNARLRSKYPPPHIVHSSLVQRAAVLTVQLFPGGLCLSFEKRIGAPTLSTSLPTGLIIEYLPTEPEHGQ